MALTLTANIDADARHCRVTGTVPEGIKPNYRFRFEGSDEILRLAGFDGWNHSDRNAWRIRRGEAGTTAESHTAGDGIDGVADAWVASDDEETPSPLAPANAQTADVQAALDGAASPSVSNVFATMADVGGGGGVQTIDCGVITAIDLVTNGPTELVPAAEGRLIRAVHFGVDGWIDSGGAAVGVYIGTPATDGNGGGGYLAHWTASGSDNTDSVGTQIAGNSLAPGGSNFASALVLTEGPLTAIAIGDGFPGGPAATWQALHAYANGAVVLAATNRLFQVQDAGGTSGASEPDWDAGPITDGDFEWTELGTVYGAAHVYADIVTPVSL